MRINALWEGPDQDKEVRAKHIVDTKRFQLTSHEHIPPLVGELIDLDNELLEDPTVATAQMCEESSQKEDEDNDVDNLIAMWNIVAGNPIN